MSKSILVLVEGRKGEVLLFDKIVQTYISELESSFEVFPYETNIYELYWKLNQLKYFGTVEYLNIFKNANIPESIKEIYLIFDLEIHHTSKNKKIVYKRKKIIDLLNFFSDEFDNGYLYINYPMFESFKDITSYDKDIYIKNKIDRNKSRNYKRIVDSKNGKLIKAIDDIDKSILDFLIYVNSYKANFILSGQRKLPRKLIDQKDLFIQIESKYISKNEVPVLNCLLMYPIMYFKEEERVKFYQNLK